MPSGAAEGFVVFSHLAELYEENGLSADVADWWKRYESRFGDAPDTAAMEGYRAASLVVEALERAGRDLTVEALIAAMESIDDYTDLWGYKIGFGPRDHKGVSESVMSAVENGRWVTRADRVTY